MNPDSGSPKSSLVVLNQRAGGLVASSVDRVTEQVENGFRRAGVAPPEIKICEPGDVKRTLKAAVESGIENVFVGGGDGTIATAAAVMRDTPTALGVLPLGTFNLVARDLGVPLALEDAAAALARGDTCAVDVASVNGRAYICVCILGFYPNMAFERKGYRGLPWWRKTIGMTCAMLRSFHDYPALDVTALIDGECARFKTRFVAVANNAYADETGLIPEKASLAGGELGLYVSHHRTTAELLNGSLSFIGGSVSSDSAVEQRRCETLQINAKRDRNLRVMLDGEILKLRTPLNFRISPGSLRIVRPCHSSAT